MKLLSWLLLAFFFAGFWFHAGMRYRDHQLATLLDADQSFVIGSDCCVFGMKSFNLILTGEPWQESK